MPNSIPLVLVSALWLLTSAHAADLMPAAQQTALVAKYCAVCHTDASVNGGLSLQHFDAAHAAPSLSAMLLSKLTGGVSAEMAGKAGQDTTATELVDRKMKGGAMGAAGIPIPDKPTIDAWIHTLATESASAAAWSVEHTDGLSISASMLREAPSSTTAGEARAYRLTASCTLASHEGSVQLAWSPVPRNGTLVLSSDGKPAVSYEVAGSEKMGNGSKVVTNGLAALAFARSGWALPSESLAVTELFPGETVVFPFASLPASARRELQACFPGAGQALVQRMCTSCHGLEGVVRARMSKDRWGMVVDDMISRGAKGTDAEVDQVVDYLAANFGAK